MEKYLINKYLDTFTKKIKKLYVTLNIEAKTRELALLEKEIEAPNFWDDNAKALSQISSLNQIKEDVLLYNDLNTRYESLLSFLTLNDDSLSDLIEEEILALDLAIKDAEELALLTNPYDNKNAIIALHPGAGGVDSQDFALLLFKMYERYASLKKFKFSVLDYQVGEEAGIKSATILISGKNAYGYLQAERGVHRLVRLSPFDANKRRHTSFASVDVTPEVGDLDFKIDPNDLKIDVYHSSGAGGQSVNTTDSAVRITHLPTNTVVTSQQERSQIKNRENAMKVLKSKLFALELKKRDAELNALKGSKSNINFGSQIRSYVFCPYTLIKDHRTNYEEVTLDALNEGKLDNFIYEYLNYLKEE